MDDPVHTRVTLLLCHIRGQDIQIIGIFEIIEMLYICEYIPDQLIIVQKCCIFDVGKAGLQLVDKTLHSEVCVLI